MGSEKMGMDRVLRRECESEIEFERERESTSCKGDPPVHQTFEPVLGRVK